jgi:hypothetical protein
MKKIILFWTIFAVIISAVLVYAISYQRTATAEEAELIGKYSALYTLKGCSHCIKQMGLFKGNEKYLNIIDCTNDLSKCYDAGITNTPSWIIDNKTYEGFKDVNALVTLVHESWYGKSCSFNP